jgi:signal transduction histidine kinase
MRLASAVVVFPASIINELNELDPPTGRVSPTSRRGNSMIDSDPVSSSVPPLRLAMIRPTRPVAIAVLMVVVSFAVSLVYSQFRLQPVTQQALAILDDAVPSIEHLSTVRTELTRIGMYVTEYVAGLGNGDTVTRKPHTVTREDIRAARRELEVELDAYRTLPHFPEEAEQLGVFEEDLAAFDEFANKALDEADAGSLDAAKLTLLESLHPRRFKADEAIVRLKSLNADHTRTSAKRILDARRDATLFATVLGIVSLAVAVVATVLVLWVLRGRARLMEEHAHLLATRAKELEAFAGRVAHELKNPLGAVALRVLSAARVHDLDPRLRDHFDKVTRQVERMDQIIEGLLTFARAGANPPPGAHADLREILDAVISDVRHAADAVDAELWIDEFSPTHLACTPGALTSILSNLLGNAVKYIGEGKRVPRRIAVHIKERADVVRVEIEDNGPGLPLGSEERAFEPFRRLTQSKQPGIGLGLATVKKIVEAYKGRVGVESKPDEGSTFWFELPKAPSEVRPSPKDSPDRRGQEVPGSLGMSVVVPCLATMSALLGGCSRSSARTTPETGATTTHAEPVGATADEGCVGAGSPPFPCVPPSSGDGW